MIRILLADDEELIRDAVAALLNLEEDLAVVAQEADGHAAVEAARKQRPDIAVVDLEMPGLDGFGVTAELGRAVPGCRVIILTGRGRPMHLRRALQTGARGFVPKGASGRTLAEVIRRVHAGERHVDPALAADALTAPECPLSDRELDVLRLAAYDLPTSTIGRRANLAGGTVRNYLAAAQQKLGAGSRAETIRIAREQGWL